MPKSEEYYLREAYESYTGITVPDGPTKSSEFWLGKLCDAVLGTTEAPRGGHRSERYYLKRLNAYALANYNINLLTSHKSLAQVIKEFLEAM